MQYRIVLPSDYDMNIVRARVATKGAALDNFAGLGFKAYLIRELGVNNSEINEYAPFYLWDDVDGMKKFLYGGVGFGGLVASFGRPPIAHYNAISAFDGPASAELPGWATLHSSPIPPHVDPAPFVANATQEARIASQESGAHTTAVAVDPVNWKLIRFSLRTECPGPNPDVEIFSVLHLSRPGHEKLTGTNVTVS